MIDKNWIETTLFTKTGNLNNRVTIMSWWINRNYNTQLEWLQQQCQYLNKNCTLTERIYNVYHNLSGMPKCKMCDNYTTFKNFKTGYLPCCSLQCATHDPDRSAKIVANTDQMAKQETMKATNLLRYGIERTSKLFAYKTKETKLERYGSANYNNIEKQRSTVFERYGVTSSSLIPSKIEKTIEARTLKIPELRNSEWLQQQNKTKDFEEIGKLLGVTEYSVNYWFRKLKIQPQYYSVTSKPQRQINQFVKSLNLDFIENDRRIIKPKHLDILIPSKSVAIEYNGLFWHSDFYQDTFNKKSHLNKTNLCLDNQIRLIQFWSSEWLSKPDICKSIISQALGHTLNTVGARQTNFVEVSKPEFKQFMDENHLHGSINSSQRYGLEYNGELIFCLGLSKHRFKQDNTYEITRSASKLNYNIPGALSKVIKNINSNFSIISYCDRRLFSGIGYKKAGFKFIKNTPPNYWYFNGDDQHLFSRISFQKHKLEEKLEYYDSNLPEHINMRNNGWYRVFDCGSSVWELNTN